MTDIEQPQKQSESLEAQLNGAGALAQGQSKAVGADGILIEGVGGSVIVVKEGGTLNIGFRCAFPSL